MVSDGQTVHFWPHSVIHNRKAVHLTSLKLGWKVIFWPPLKRQNFRDAYGLNCYPHLISCHRTLLKWSDWCSCEQSYIWGAVKKQRRFEKEMKDLHITWILWLDGIAVSSVHTYWEQGDNNAIWWWPEAVKYIYICLKLVPQEIQTKTKKIYKNCAINASC